MSRTVLFSYFIDLLNNEFSIKYVISGENEKLFQQVSIICRLNSNNIAENAEAVIY